MSELDELSNLSDSPPRDGPRGAGNTGSNATLSRLGTLEGTRRTSHHTLGSTPSADPALDLASLIQAAVDAEAQAIVDRLFRTDSNETKVVKIRSPIDQPDKVRERITTLLAEAGFLPHPQRGELGSYTLVLEHDVPPDVYPIELWIRSSDNPALTGWYTMRDEEDHHGLPIWDRVQGDGVGGACLFGARDGRWVLGPSLGSGEAWLASTTAATSEAWGRSEAPFASPLPAMPHACSWSFYDRETSEWRNAGASQLAVAYVPPSLSVGCAQNPALQGSYALLHAPHNGHPVYAHDTNPSIELFRDSSGAWLVGQREKGSGWLTSVDTEASASEASARHGLFTPDRVRNWVVFNAVSSAWEPGGMGAGATRQRKHRSVCRVVYCLSQTSQQKLLALDEASAAKIEDLAVRIADAVLEVIHAGCMQGQRHFDEVLPLLPLLQGSGAPSGDDDDEGTLNMIEEVKSIAESAASGLLGGSVAASSGRKPSSIDPKLSLEAIFYTYHKHILDRAAEHLGDNAVSSLDGVELSLARGCADGQPNVLLFTYTVEDLATPADVEEAADKVMMLVRAGREGTWIREFFAVPPDALAEKLCERGLADFAVAEAENTTFLRGTQRTRQGVDVAVRIPWGTSRELWDHGEMDGISFSLPPQGLDVTQNQVARAMRRLSPPRRPVGCLEDSSRLDVYPPYPASPVFGVGGSRWCSQPSGP